jgi:uncharacterized protein (TIGR03000 family)
MPPVAATDHAPRWPHAVATADRKITSIACLITSGCLFLGHPVWAGESKPAVFEVRLPADAELKLNGVRTRAKGEMRRFESPPLEVGSTYAYTLQATWHDQSVTREVILRPGRGTIIDLREELKAKAPAGSISLRAPPVVTLAAGQETFLAIHVHPDNLNAPVTLCLSNLPGQIEVAPAASGSGDRDTWRGVLRATNEAEPSTSTVTVHARAGSTRAEVSFELVVTRKEGVRPRTPDKGHPAVSPRLPQNEKIPAYLKVEIPADALLELNGTRTQLKGQTRSFETPPLDPGRVHPCDLRATWRGQSLSRKVMVRPGKEVVVDLRRELHALVEGAASSAILQASTHAEVSNAAPELSIPESLDLPVSRRMTPQTRDLSRSPMLQGPAGVGQAKSDVNGSPTKIQFVQESDVYPVLAAEESPKPAVGVASAQAPPDRWFVMRALQGTWAGAALDGERMSISGWTDVSFTASSVQENQLPMGFNYLANQFALQQNWVRFERFVVTNGTSEPTFGFRSDTILPGIDYRFTVSRGLFSDQLTSNDGQPNTYGIDPVQFYGEAYFPTIGRGLDVKVGRMFCQYGAESIDAPPNALASHSYAFIYDPFTHTGVIGSQQLTPAWSVQFGVIMGPDVFIDPAASPYGMFSVKWTPPGGRDSVLLSGLFGSGRFNVAEQFNNPNIIDLVYVHTFSARLSYTLDSLFGYQTIVPDIGTATWFSFVNYLTLKFTPRLSGTARLEFFDDIDGNRTGFAGLYTALTAGLNFQPRKEIIFRPEVRYDYNNESRPFQGHHGVLTATTDVIVRW